MNIFKVRKGNVIETSKVKDKTHPYSRLMQYFISIGIFDIYQANVEERQRKHLIHEDMATRPPAQVLSTSFVYQNTKEGVEFWQNVQNELPVDL
jgi:hypothetical protein